MFGLYNFQGLFVCGGVNELFMIDTVGTVAVKPRCHTVGSLYLCVFTTL